MFLTNKLIERTRAHSGGERRGASCLFNVLRFLFVKQIGHSTKVRWELGRRTRNWHALRSV
jgi:hypothetical protein